MTKINTRDFEQLFNHINRFAIGYEPIFERFGLPDTSPSYPPFNIIKFETGDFTIEFALAGFKKEEIKIQMKDNYLTVTGDKSNSPLYSSDAFVHHGIATRSFVREFKLSEYLEVREASFVDGILQIILKQNIPEEAKPKAIPIN
jgi:molecular chaperone IbpA